MMNNTFFAVNDLTQFVVGVYVGNPTVPGLTFIERTDSNRFVREGFLLVEGAFVDARATYVVADKFVGVG